MIFLSLIHPSPNVKICLVAKYNIFSTNHKRYKYFLDLFNLVNVMSQRYDKSQNLIFPLRD